MVRKFEEDGFAGPQWEMTVYETTDLADLADDVADRVVADYIADSLSRIGVNYRIYWDFMSVPIDNTNMSCPDGDLTAYEEWKNFLEVAAPFVATDSNLLVVHADGGGCGAIGGNVAVSSGRNIDHDPQTLSAPPTNATVRNIHGSMHEGGHNMGFVHSPHPGDAFNDFIAEEWNKTPCVGSATDTVNLCGEAIEPREFQDRRFWIDYHDCVAEEIQIEGSQVITVTALDADTDIVVGDTVTISVDLTNRTPVSEDAAVSVFVDGTEVGVAEATVPAFETKTATVSWTPSETGEHTISAGDLSITRTVEGEGTIEIISVSASPLEVAVGEKVTVTATIENTTDLLATPTRDVIAFRINRPEQQIGTMEFVVDAGETDTDSIDWTPDVAGDWTIEVGDRTTSVTVTEPTDGAVRITDVTVDGTPRVGETTQISVSADNTGNTSASRDVTIAVDGSTIGTVSFSLDPGESAVKKVSWSPVATGETVISAETASITVDVESGTGTGEPPETPIVSTPTLAGIALAIWFIGRPE